MILDPQRRSVYQVFVLVGTVRGYLINKYFIAALVRTELSPNLFKRLAVCNAIWPLMRDSLILARVRLR